MRQLLTDWKNKHTIVSLFCDENDADTFLSGYIMDCDEDWVLIGHITPRGEYDGYILKAIDDIIHIESQGKYEAKMELLYSLKNQKPHPAIDRTKDITLFHEIINKCEKEKCLTTIEIMQDDACTLTGRIQYRDGMIVIKKIDEYGEPDGMAYAEEKDVSAIAFDNADLQDLQLLCEAGSMVNGRIQRI